MAEEPPKHRKEWSASEVGKLAKLAKQNTPTRVVALKLGRTLAAVQQKASNEGISLKPVNQRPYGTRR